MYKILCFSFKHILNDYDKYSTIYIFKFLFCVVKTDIFKNVNIIQDIR